MGVCGDSLFNGVRASAAGGNAIPLQDEVFCLATTRNHCPDSGLWRRDGGGVRSIHFWVYSRDGAGPIHGRRGSVQSHHP